MAEVDYSMLPLDELVERVREEEEHLNVLRADLASAEKRRAEIQEAIRTERLPRYEERIPERAKRIAEVEAHIAEREERIRFYEERIRAREEIIRRLEAEVPRPWRRVAAYRGWQTRDRRRIEDIRRELASLRKSLGTLRIWQIREEPLLTRLTSLREDLTAITGRIATLRTEIATEETRLEEKRKFVNKLIALHKRWFYESPRGTYHNISIEAIATIIVPATERKEDYEDKLREAMEEHLFGKPGFERLTELSEEILGFEETYTDQKARGIVVEDLRWQHKIVKEKQLKIEDFLKG
ncbi:MAG: hypothetical protein QXI87_08035 [Thermoproteota archaeon]